MMAVVRHAPDICNEANREKIEFANPLVIFVARSSMGRSSVGVFYHHGHEGILPPFSFRLFCWCLFGRDLVKNAKKKNNNKGNKK